MKLYILIKKEIQELIRTKKAMILIIVFSLFGILGPISAIFEPKFVEMMLNSLGEGITMEIPEPNYVNSYLQMFNNLNQAGILVLILLVVGAVVHERINGTAVLVLTKCVSRKDFILSKLYSRIILFAIACFVSIILSITYTQILFSESLAPHLFFAFFIYFIYGVFIIAATILISTVSKSFAISTVVAIGNFIFLGAVSIIPHVEKYIPNKLLNLTSNIINGSNTIGDSVTPIVITILLTITTTWFSIYLFKKQEI